MDTVNNRSRTDQALYGLTIPYVLKDIEPETKIAIFDELATTIGAILNDHGCIRTENMLEQAAAIATNGTVVQATGYDIVACMKHKTEVKSTGTRPNKKKETGGVAKGNCSGKTIGR